MSDYRNFKTPFYEIKIKDPAGKREVNLPDHLIRLVKSVEITETFAGYNVDDTTGTDVSMATIVFVEGSREPAGVDSSLGTEGLYKISLDGKNKDRAISGSMTNRPGLITDLRFSGSGGITFITTTEKEDKAIDASIQKNVFKESTTRAHKGEVTAPKFLFQEYNEIEIRWGYKETKEIRSFIGVIVSAKVDYSSDGIQTTIRLQEKLGILNKFGPKEAVQFSTTLNKLRDNLHKGMTARETILKLAKSMGLKTIISENLPADTVDMPRSIPAGDSFTDFMGRLADQNHCVWRIVKDPKTLNETLIFAKISDFEARAIIPDGNLLTYKANGSIIKDISINATFLQPTPPSILGKDPEGKDNAEEGLVDQVLFKNKDGKQEERLNTDPSSSPLANNVKNAAFNGATTGKAEISPSDNKGIKETKAIRQAFIVSNILTLDLTTVGWPKLRPGVVTINNIGVRYSGKYRLISVTHTIDASGYVSKCVGQNFTVNAGGTPSTGDKKGQESEKMANVSLFVRDEIDRATGAQ